MKLRTFSVVRKQLLFYYPFSNDVYFSTKIPVLASKWRNVEDRTIKEWLRILLKRPCFLGLMKLNNVIMENIEQLY